MSAEKACEKNKILGAAVIVSGLAFLLWRARYGWCWDDEAFLVSLAQRLWYGQSLISDEWHVAQFTGVLILPFYSLFRLFAGGNTGVLLTLRYVYCVMWFAVCLCAYRVLSRKNIGAIWAYIYLVLFSPLDYMTLSYTSFGLMSALLICCLYYRHFEIKPLKAPALGILSSLLWCVLVLSCPYMAAGYLLLFVGTTVNATVKKRRREPYDGAFFKARFIDLALTALIAAFVVYFFILRGNSLEDIFYGLEQISGDPEHLPADLLGRLGAAFSEYDVRSRLMLIAAAALLCLAPIMKKRPLRKLSAFALASLAYAAVIFNYLRTWRLVAFNGQAADIVPLGLVCYVYLSEKPRGLFRFFVPMSFFYGLCAALGSNTGGKALFSCLTIAGAAGLLFIAALGRELWNELRGEKLSLVRMLPAVITVLVMLTQLTCSLSVRLTRQYLDREFSALTETVECGAAKGLVVRPETKREYEKKYHSLRRLLGEAGADEDTDGFMTPEFYPVLYLDAELPTASFSVWSYGYYDKLYERLSEYYDHSPGKKPTLIFCSADEDEELADRLLGEYETYTDGDAVLFRRK